MSQKGLRAGRLAARPKTKLLPMAHTGRLRTHSHTSYGGLVLILLLAMLPIVFSQRIVNADDPVGVSAVVASALPTTAPTIQGVPDGKVLTSNDSLTITGSCQAKTVVKIFKNHVLAGATPCKGGSYSLPIDLFIGTNSLTARAYNADTIPGPESSPITVKLLPSVNTTSAADAAANQFYLTSDAFYRGASVGHLLRWPLTIVGGQAPYLIDVSWGDGKTEQIGRGQAGQFTISHTYDKAPGDNGSYTVVVKGSDQTKATAILQLTAVVPDTTITAATTAGGPGSWFKTEIAGQAVITTTLIVISFWVGERHEFKILQRKAVA